MEAGRKRPRNEDYQSAERAIHKVAATAALHKHRASLAQVRHFTSVAKHETLKADLRDLDTVIESAKRQIKQSSSEIALAKQALASKFTDAWEFRRLLDRYETAATLAIANPADTSNQLPKPAGVHIISIEWIKGVLLAFMETQQSKSFAWDLLHECIVKTALLFESAHKSSRKATTQLVLDAFVEMADLPGFPLKRVGDKAFWFTDRVEAIVIPATILTECRLAVQLVEAKQASKFMVAHTALPVGVSGLDAASFATYGVRSLPTNTVAPPTRVTQAASGAASADFVLDWSGSADQQAHSLPAADGEVFTSAAGASSQLAAATLTRMNASASIGWLTCLPKYALNEEGNVFAALATYSDATWTAGFPRAATADEEGAVQQTCAQASQSIVCLKHYSQTIYEYASALDTPAQVQADPSLRFAVSVLECIVFFQSEQGAAGAVPKAAALAQAVHMEPIRGGTFLTLQEVEMVGALVHRDKFAGLTAVPPEFRAMEAALGEMTNLRATLQALVIVSILRACNETLMGGAGFCRTSREDGTELSSAARHYLHVLLVRGAYIVPEELASQGKSIQKTLSGNAASVCSESELMQVLLSADATFPSDRNSDQATLALESQVTNSQLRVKYISSMPVSVDLNSLVQLLEVLLGRQPRQHNPPSLSPMFSSLTVEEAKNILRSALEKGDSPNQAAITDFLRLARSTSKSGGVDPFVEAEAEICTLAAHVLLPGLKRGFDFEGSKRFIRQAQAAYELCQEQGMSKPTAAAPPKTSLEADKSTGPSFRSSQALEVTATHTAQLSGRFQQAISQAHSHSTSSLASWEVHTQAAVGTTVARAAMRKLLPQSEGLLFALALVCGGIPAPILASRYSGDAVLQQLGSSVCFLRAVQSSLLQRRLLVETFATKADEASGQESPPKQPWRAQAAFTWLHKQLKLAGASTSVPRCTSWVLLVLLSRQLDSSNTDTELEDGVDTLSVVREWSEASIESSQAALAYAHYKLHLGPTTRASLLGTVSSQLLDTAQNSASLSEPIRFSCFAASIVLSFQTGSSALGLANLRLAVTRGEDTKAEDKQLIFGLDKRICCLLTMLLCGISESMGIPAAHVARQCLAGGSTAYLSKALAILQTPNLEPARIWSHHCAQVFNSTFGSAIAGGKTPSTAQYRRIVSACASQSPACRVELSMLMRLLSRSNIQGMGVIALHAGPFIRFWNRLDGISHNPNDIAHLQPLALMEQAETASGQKVARELQRPGLILCMLNHQLLSEEGNTLAMRSLERFVLVKQKFTPSDLRRVESFSWESLRGDQARTQSILDAAGRLELASVDSSTALSAVHSVMIVASALLSCRASVAAAETTRLLSVQMEKVDTLLNRCAAGILQKEESSFARMQRVATASTQLHLAQVDALLATAFPGANRATLPIAAAPQCEAFPADHGGGPALTLLNLACSTAAGESHTASVKPGKIQATLLQVLWAAVNLFKQLRWLAYASQPADASPATRHLHAWLSSSLAEVSGLERYGAIVIDCLEVEWVNMLEDFYFSRITDLIASKESPYAALLRDAGMSFEMLMCKLSCPPPGGIPWPPSSAPLSELKSIWRAQRFSFRSLSLSFDAVAAASAVKPFMHMQASTFPSLLNLDAQSPDTHERLQSADLLLPWEFLANLPIITASSVPRSLLHALGATEGLPPARHLVRAILAQYICAKQPACEATWSLRFSIAQANHTRNTGIFLVKLLKDALGYIWPTALFSRVLNGLMVAASNKGDANRVAFHLYDLLNIQSPHMVQPNLKPFNPPAVISAAVPEGSSAGNSAASAAGTPERKIAPRSKAKQLWESADQPSVQSIQQLGDDLASIHPTAFAGYIFMCSNETQEQVLQNGFAAMPLNETNSLAARRIFTGSTRIFLANFESRQLFGAFVATTRVSTRKKKAQPHREPSAPFRSTKAFPLGCKIGCLMKIGPVPFACLPSLMPTRGSRMPNILIPELVSELLQDLCNYYAQTTTQVLGGAVQSHHAGIGQAGSTLPSLSIKWQDDETASDMDLSPASTDIDEDAAEDSS